jgi:hypothetical protein
METFNIFGALVIGVIVRVAVPVAITTMLVYMFTRLDARWKAEAEQQKAPAVNSRMLAKNPGCWEINGCSDQKKKVCKAYANPDVPCWQLFRTKEGLLRERCIGCDVFKQAPIPVAA